MTEERLDVLDALVAAQDRYDEVSATVEHAADDDDAASQLMALLTLPRRELAVMVLDLQLRRRTQAGRRLLHTERDELRAQLGRG